MWVKKMETETQIQERKERQACLRPDDVVLVEVQGTALTLGECLTLCEDYARNHPEREVFLDGDSYSFIARVRA